MAITMKVTIALDNPRFAVELPVHASAVHARAVHASAGSLGKLVSMEDTFRGFKGLVAGDYDHLPEQAFYMVGNIDEAIAKAQKMAAEAA
jgi:F0F1-type ATP synthase beta subunit